MAHCVIVLRSVISSFKLFFARSRKLKSLNIAYCNDMVPEALIEVVQKLPLLEELSLTNTKLTTDGIEALGRFCPRLKLFELNSSHYQRQHMDFDDSNERDIINNSNALAIAKNFPALHHL
ncbi:putative F-box/LRR-repeat protein 21 [Lycium ferocissimum]|uniref:putative F-box/LRR-repeat protein 21 n=1 Tax=Lycium ferocissimum TaxID=112874 RepID=UPI0028160EBD|nr:putative F-box/LRR-repeat protein 21 [Lycium ferocissimum]